MVSTIGNMVKTTGKQVAIMCCVPCGGLTKRAVDKWRAWAKRTVNLHPPPLATNASRWKAKAMSQVYDVILADPPWSFKVWNKDTGNGRSAEAHYPTMSLDDICALPIKELASQNCALFMWSVWPSIFDAEKVINAWGFKYKTLGFEWWKLNKSWERAWVPMLDVFSGYKWLERLFFFGMGYYTRTNSEPCLLATRGSMPVAVHDERNFIIAPVREHSRKPDEQYEKIERLYPNARKLELFARRRRPGWDVFGNQVETSIRLPTPREPDSLKDGDSCLPDVVKSESNLPA